MNNVKITALEVQNVKRIKALRIDIGKALTVIGGRNGQGKTSALDAIAFALGGNRFKPSHLQREGSIADPAIKVTLSNGLIVERKGKNATLSVTDPKGVKSGQQLLNDFVSALSIDLPKFLNSTETEKTKMLLDLLGIGDELNKLTKEEERLYNQRHAVGTITERKTKHALEMPVYDGVPEAPVSIAELIQQQQAILAKNGENQRLRNNLGRVTQQYNFAVSAFDKAQADLIKWQSDLDIAQKSASDLLDNSTAELETSIRTIEDTNIKVRANSDHERAEMEAAESKREYSTLTASIETCRTDQLKLLEGVTLPLEGLSVTNGKLTYNGKNWDCMSSSEQLRVGAAIAQAINPKCGFILLDKAEQFDTQTLTEFGQWLDDQGLQAICTRVSTGDECSIVIEDGFVVGDESFHGDNQLEAEAPADAPSKGWKSGEF